MAWLTKLLLDREDRPDKYAVAFVMSFLVSTWAMVYLTLHDRLTEWFYTAYLGVYVVGALGKTFAMVSRDNAAQPTSPATPPAVTDPK